MKLLYSALLLFFPAALLAAVQPPAQVGNTVRGIVIDNITGRPLAGATVRLAGGESGKITDKAGHFQMLLPQETGVIIVTFVGYAEDSARVKAGEYRTIALKPADVQSEEITVTGQRPGNETVTRETAVITPADMDAHRGQTFGKTLETVAGVTTLQTGASVAKPVIRGLHSQRIVLVNAGIPMEGQQWGAEHAPEIDPFSPNSIAVIKGAAGVEYGVGSIGGVIRVEPRPFPELPGIGGVVSLNGFSNNRQFSGSALVESRLADVENLAFRVQFSGRRAGDYSTAEYVAGNTGFAEADVSAAAELPASDNLKFDATYSRFSTTLGVYKGSHVGTYDDLKRAITLGRPPVDFSFSYDIAGPKQEISHDLWSLGAEWSIPDAGKIQLRYGFQVNNREEFDARRRYSDTLASAPFSSFALRLQTYSGEVTFRHTPSGGFSGAAGISGMIQSNAGRSRVFLIPDFDKFSAGAYIYEEYVTPSAAFSAGVRADVAGLSVAAYPPKTIPDTSLQFTGVSAMAGALFYLDEHWSFSLNIASGWRTPPVNELYSDGVHHGAAQFESGRRNLLPERSITADAGVTVHHEAFEARANVFVNRLSGYIFMLPDTVPVLTLRGLFPVMRYTQTEAMLYGGELTVHYALTDFLRFDATAAVTIGDDITADIPLFQMPANRLRIGAHSHFENIFGVISDGFFEITGHFVARQNRFARGQDYIEPPAGYILAGLMAGGEFPAAGTIVKFSFEVENLFNARYRDYLSRYRYFLDDAGRNFIIRISVPFGAAVRN